MNIKAMILTCIAAALVLVLAFALRNNHANSQQASNLNAHPDNAFKLAPQGYVGSASLTGSSAAAPSSAARTPAPVPPMPLLPPTASGSAPASSSAPATSAAPATSQTNIKHVVNDSAVVLSGRVPSTSAKPAAIAQNYEPVQQPYTQVQPNYAPVQYGTTQTYYSPSVQRQRVVYRKYHSGRVHLGRAMKHIIGFSVKLPFKLSP